VHGDCQRRLKREHRAHSLFPLIDDTDTHPSPSQGRPTGRLEVRSVTGACYTLIEEADRDDSSERACRRYRTAYAGLPAIANDDGSFTLIDTQTRLVPVSVR
jgi:hypothetical protein